jgi:hypothetical protein
VYRFFSLNGSLYVGRTEDVAARFNSHSTQSEWWVDVDRYELTFHGTFEEAFNVERQQILELEPVHNRYRFEPSPEPPPRPRPAYSDKPTPGDGRLLPTSVAAKELRITRTTLAKWVKKYDLQPAMTTLGGQYRWDLDDLRRQIREVEDRLIAEGQEPDTP